jgi:arabinose-5-phosphate isomerase
MGQPARAKISNHPPLRPEIKEWGREVLRIERLALENLESQLEASPITSLGAAFESAVQLIANCQGNVLLTGMGKAGWVARKISATLASTGAPSHYFHPGEAFHGDLGRIRTEDCVWILSQSGETEEVVRLLPTLKQLKTPIIALTAAAQSSTGRAAQVVLELGDLEEACPHGLAPTTSTTAMMALGDAIAISVSQLKGFQAEDFARFHPGGALGRKMAKVQDCMRLLAECRVAQQSQTVREILVSHRRAGRRSGAILLCDDVGRLSGIFTDSDLARLLESNRDSALDRPICEVMTRNPSTIIASARMQEALGILAAKKISELPVIDLDHRPLGMVDVTDVVGWTPSEPAPEAAPENAPVAPLQILPFPRTR